MKIPHQKEFAMKKAIMIAIEKGESVSALASYFGVSKSTIYKYRRALRDQGFIVKNENDIYVVTENKFSKKQQAPKTAEMNFDEYIDENLYTKQKESINQDMNTKASREDISISETQYNSIKEIPTDDAMEQRLQSKVEKMRNDYDANHSKKGLFKKIISFIKS